MADGIERAASDFGRPATSRAVGEIVRELAREKLSAERAAIEAALAARPVREGGAVTIASGLGTNRSDHDAAPPSWGLVPGPPPTFVGRDDHLERASRLFDKTRAVVVTGPAGGGKSAFTRAIVAANAGGRETRSFQCTSDGRALDAMESMLGLERIATSDADRASVLARQLDARELVVAIEDTHVLPPAELARLLQVVAVLRRATVIVTSRQALELADEVPGAVYVDLAPLDDSDARVLVADLLDRRGAKGDVDAIVRAAAGNPLWCTLLSGAGRLSDQLVSLIEDLDTPTMEVLQRLALFRRPVPQEWVGGRREMAILASRYLCALAGKGRVEMHDVVRTAIASSLSHERAAEIHVSHASRWADAGDQDERFHHLVASGDLRALRDALAEGLDAWLVARVWLPCITTFIARFDAAGIEVGSRLRFREAAEHAYGGRLAEARRAIERAGEPAASDVLVECVARISLIYAERGSATERDRLLERASAARQREGQRPSADWIRLMVAAIWDHSARGDRSRAIELCQEVLADSSTRPSDRAKVLRTAADLTLDAASGHRDLDEAEPLLAELGSPYLSALSDIVRARLYLEQGEVSRARVAYERALPVIVQHDHTVTVGIYGRALGPRFEAASGKVEEAIVEMRRWIDERPDEQQVAQRSWANAVMCLAAREADHAELARRCARVVLRTPYRERHRYDVAEALLSLAAARAEGDRPDRALRATLAALESARRGGLPFVAAPALALLGDVLGASGRLAGAEQLAELTLQSAMAMDLPRVRVRSLVLLGRLALRAGITERARERGEEAADIALATGQKWEHARAASLAGWASYVRGREDEARAWLARAEHDRFEAPRALGAGLTSLALVLDGRDGEPFPWWLPPELTSVHLELDAESLRVTVDGSRVVDFTSQPLLAKNPPNDPDRSRCEVGQGCPLRARVGASVRPSARRCDLQSGRTGRQGPRCRRSAPVPRVAGRRARAEGAPCAPPPRAHLKPECEEHEPDRAHAAARPAPSAAGDAASATAVGGGEAAVGSGSCGVTPGRRAVGAT